MIQFYTRKYYGRKRSYFSDPVQAKAFERLTKRKTFDQTDKINLSKLGVTFEEVANVPTTNN